MVSMGQSWDSVKKVTAHVTSRADGTVAGAAAVDYMLQIWAPSPRLHGKPEMVDV